MEEEIRFYFNDNQYENLINKFKNIPELKYDGCYLTNIEEIGK